MRCCANDVFLQLFSKVFMQIQSPTFSNQTICLALALACSGLIAPAAFAQVNPVQMD